MSDALEIRRIKLTKESEIFLERLLAFLEENGNDFYVPLDFSFYGKVGNTPNDFIELTQKDTKGYRVLESSIHMTTALRLMLGRRIIDKLDVEHHLST